MAPKPKELWLPKAFDGAGPIYFMDAGHRGDMYHLRAAMQLPGRDYSLVLYLADVSPGSKKAETQDYLKRPVDLNKKNSFFCPWIHNQIAGDDQPTDFQNCRLNGQPYDGNNITRVKPDTYGEHASTVLIADASSNGLPAGIKNGMALLIPDTKT